MNRGPIFVGGMPRSGTTLMRVMLDSHPNIACGPELRVIPALCSFSAQTRAYCGETLRDHYNVSASALNETFAQLILSFLEPYRLKHEKTRIAEKTPANVLHFKELSTLFPSAHFIHLIRDGRDVVSSLLTMDWKDGRSGQPMAITKDPTAASAAWKRHIQHAREAQNSGVRVTEIRYENLIEAPEKTLKDILNDLGEPWRDETLLFYRNDTVLEGMEESSAAQVAKPLFQTSIRRWKTELSDAAKTAIKTEAGDLLIELGYAQDHDW